MPLVNNQFSEIAQNLDVDNSAIDISITTTANEIIVIHAIYPSFSGNVAKAELTIEEDATEIFKHIFDDTDVIEFPVPLSLAKGADLDVKLTASGTGGTLGNLVVLYNKQSAGQ